MKPSISLDKIYYSLLIIVTISMNGCIPAMVADSIKSESFSGTIINKSKGDTGCFGLLIIKQHTTLDTVRICYCVSKDNDLYNYVMAGDVIAKEKESMTVSIKRAGQIKLMEYPTCIH